MLHCASAWKSGNSFPLVRHRYHSCDLGKNAMMSAQLYTPCFQALWSSGSENYNIVRSHVHYIIRSKYKYHIQNKILSLHHGLWRAGSSEHRVIPSMLMKRGWKYPLKHKEGGEGTPLEDSQLEALMWFSRLALIVILFPTTHLGSMGNISCECVKNLLFDWKMQQRIPQVPVENVLKKKLTPPQK